MPALVSQTGCSDVNTALFQMFSMSGRAEDEMPPNHHALYKHIQLFNYQATVFKCCVEQHPSIPSPVGNGWKITDNDLNIDWMHMEPAEKSISELSMCTFRKSKCKTNEGNYNCCALLGLPCTELCKCKKYENGYEYDFVTADLEVFEDDITEDNHDVDEEFEGEESFI